MVTNWEPILRAHPLASRADAILRSVVNVSEEYSTRFLDEASVAAPAASSRSAVVAADLAIAFAHVEASPRLNGGARVDRLLAHAIGGAGRAYLSPWLYEGFTGVAFALEHVRPRISVT